jgi:HK97 gp10 family phage protein
MARALSVTVRSNRIAEVSDTLRRRAREEQLACANRILERAQAVVPVRTGALRASIQVAAPSATPTGPAGMRSITVSAGMFYAPFIEFGTRYMAARPYLRPAAEAERDRYTNAVARIGDELS